MKLGPGQTVLCNCSSTRRLKNIHVLEQTRSEPVQTGADWNQTSKLCHIFNGSNQGKPVPVPNFIKLLSRNVAWQISMQKLSRASVAIVKTLCYLFLLGKTFLCLAIFCAYRLNGIEPLSDLNLNETDFTSHVGQKTIKPYKTCQ